jgi:hypothetical protein
MKLVVAVVWPFRLNPIVQAGDGKWSRPDGERREPRRAQRFGQAGKFAEQ